MTNLLLKIRKILKSKADEEIRINIKKFVPTVKRSYGIKLPVLDKLANRFKNNDFAIVEALWNSGIFEEKIRAAKIFGKICKNNPKKSLSLIKKFTKKISDWAVCDTLAIQGIRKIAKIQQKEIFKLAKKLVSSKSLWERRFGIVLLINFKKERELKNRIKKILKTIKNEKEYYVKKAILWLKKEIGA